MNNGKHGQGTDWTKMGADKSAENTPKPKLSAQAQKFEISMKKGFIGYP